MTHDVHADQDGRPVDKVPDLEGVQVGEDAGQVADPQAPQAQARQTRQVARHRLSRGADQLHPQGPQGEVRLLAEGRVAQGQIAHRRLGAGIQEGGDGQADTDLRIDDGGAAAGLTSAPGGTSLPRRLAVSNKAAIEAAAVSTAVA